MIKFVTVAALAAFAAGPAFAEEIRVSVAGKTQAQLQAEIVSAAREVCGKASGHDALWSWTFASCMRDALNRTEPQLARLSLR